MSFYNTVSHYDQTGVSGADSLQTSEGRIKQEKNKEEETYTGFKGKKAQ
jgi:hypothetical protein